MALAMLLCSCGNSISETSLPQQQTKASAEEITASQTSAAQPDKQTTASAEAEKQTAASTASKTETSATETTKADETVSETDAPAAVTTTDITAASNAEPAEQEPVIPYCTAAAVYCMDTDTLLYSKNPDSRISLASITKLLTASAALKYMNSQTVVTAGTEIGLVKPDSTTAFLSIGSSMTLEELIYAMLLPSGNDAAYTAAVSTARALYPGTYLTDYQAVDIFVGLMNEFASELGMSHSHFANPEGWDDPNHYTTLSDLMKLINYAMNVPVIKAAVASSQKTVWLRSGGYLTWTNTNLFLNPAYGFYDASCIGIKTGTTEAAGCCLASAFLSGGRTYVIIVMGSGDNLTRYNTALALKNYYVP